MATAPTISAIPADLTDLARRLSADAPGAAVARGVEVHADLTSTNDRALVLAAAGAGHGQVVVSDRQTEGRGRRGRTWTSAASEGLLLSMVVRPVGSDPAWGWLPLATGVAVRRSLARFAGSGHQVTLKWPNDVRIDGRKVAGILVERRLQYGHDDRAAVVGVGINVNGTSFPGSVRQAATSLRLATGRFQDRALLGETLVTEMDQVIAAWMRNDPALRQAYSAALDGVGRPVTIRAFDSADAVRGDLVGVDDDGSLVLRCPDGLRTFAAGDVTLSEP